jgi:hypothetical protein
MSIYFFPLLESRITMITGLVAPNWNMVARLSVHDTSDEQEALTLAAKLPRHRPNYSVGAKSVVAPR